MDFLILGLPRSRTAWLANFMTDSGIFCHHDAINGCHNMTEYLAKTKGCGDSDTALAMFDYAYYIPDVKTVIIDSSIDKSVSFGFEQGCDITNSMQLMKEHLDYIDGLHVAIEDIDSRLEEIWTYLTDKTFHVKRAEQLIKLNIQVKDIYDIDFNAMANFIENTREYYPQAA